MRLLIPLLVFSTLCGCGSKDSNRSAKIPTPETFNTLRNVKAGSGGECINFDSQYVVQEDGVYEKFDMFRLEANSFGEQKYRLNLAETEKLTFKDFLDEINISDLRSTSIDVMIQALIFDHVKKNVNKIIDLTIGGVIADGSIQNKTFKFETSALSKLIEMPDVEFPIKYSVDCFTEEKQYTSIHLRIGEWAGRMVFSKNLDDSIDVETRELNEDGTDIIVEKDLLITTMAYEQIKYVEEQKELQAIPQAYRSLHGKGLNIRLTSKFYLEQDNMVAFAAFYNNRTKDYKILRNGIDSNSMLDYIAIPLTFFEAQKDLIESDDWDFVISLSPEKTDGFIFKTKYHFPLDGRNEPINDDSGRPVVLTNKFLKCLINKNCDSIKVDDEINKNLNIVYSDQKVSFVISLTDFKNEDHTLKTCIKPNAKKSCFKDIQN